MNDARTLLSADLDDEPPPPSASGGDAPADKAAAYAALASRLVDSFNLSQDDQYRKEAGRRQLNKLPNPKLKHMSFAYALGPRPLPLQPEELRVLRRPRLRELPARDRV